MDGDFVVNGYEMIVGEEARHIRVSAFKFGHLQIKNFVNFIRIIVSNRLNMNFLSGHC
jgi:hypothetical protein